MVPETWLYAKATAPATALFSLSWCRSWVFEADAPGDGEGGRKPSLLAAQIEVFAE